MLHSIYFSAKGTTETCAACIGRGLNMEMKPYNRFDTPCTEPLEISIYIKERMRVNYAD